VKILLVEDDPGVGRFISQGLTEDGNEVVWLKRGDEAPDRLRSDDFSAAIVDLGLPDMDGLELCRMLRADGVDTPICILTARASLEDKLEGFASGADDYLPKPFAFEELVVRLNAIARRRENAKGQILRVGTLEIDRNARRAKIAGREIELSKREFDVLVTLAEGGGEPVGRDHIRRAVWGEERDVTGNVVDVYIGYVRKRLADHPGAPRLRSARGQGFTLDFSA